MAGDFDARHMVEGAVLFRSGLGFGRLDPGTGDCPG